MMDTSSLGEMSSRQFENGVLVVKIFLIGLYVARQFGNGRSLSPAFETSSAKTSLKLLENTPDIKLTAPTKESVFIAAFLNFVIILSLPIF